MEKRTAAWGPGPWLGDGVAGCLRNHSISRSLPDASFTTNSDGKPLISFKKQFEMQCRNEKQFCFLNFWICWIFWGTGGGSRRRELGLGTAGVRTPWAARMVARFLASCVAIAKSHPPADSGGQHTSSRLDSPGLSWAKIGPWPRWHVICTSVDSPVISLVAPTDNSKRKLIQNNSNCHSNVRFKCCQLNKNYVWREAKRDSFFFGEIEKWFTHSAFRQGAPLIAHAAQTDLEFSLLTRVKY